MVCGKLGEKVFVFVDNIGLNSSIFMVLLILNCSNRQHID